MLLYMPTEGFTWGGTLPLTDQAGRVRYHVAGEAYTWGKRLYILDLAGRKAVSVRQTVPALLPTYELEIYGKPLGNLVRDLTYAPPRCTLDALGWELYGLLGSLEYDLKQGADTVGTCRRDPERSGQLILTLPEDRQTLPALGVMAAVNCILAPQSPRRP